MAVRYITADDFDALVGADVRQSLWDDGSGYDSAVFNRSAEFASVLARAAAENAGYTTSATETDGSTSDDMTKMLALSALVRMGYSRKQLSVPPDLLELIGGLLEAARTGDLPIPDLSPTERDAVGGVKFTNSSATAASGKPPIFADLHKLY